MKMRSSKGAILGMSLAPGLAGTASRVAGDTSDGKAKSRCLCQRSMPWGIKYPAREGPSWT
jgi:hypothetical protein